ncbi:MAG TPA: hypothetical protein DEA47_01075 [Peptococcaceae bacterium]|nr:MAG: hypothetical protein XD50_0273 [Clostridia bacterium 41_269]HBT19956.1 hypothetical protein [Peptococcaceae bacterium]
MFGRKKKDGENKNKSRQKSRNKQESEVLPLFRSKVTDRDIVAPSSIRESSNEDMYWVEIGDPGGTKRYYRSFYANISGNATSAGMLNSLYSVDFGEADCDVALHIAPADTSRTVWQIEREIARLEADFAEEANSARRQTIFHEIQELRRRHASLRTGSEKLFYSSIQVTVSSDDIEKMSRFCNLLVRRLGARNLVLKAADMRQFEAFLNMTPLSGTIPRDALQDMESSNIADIFPFGTGGLRHRDGVIIGRDPQGGVIFYDCWHPLHENYNILVFGRSGAGKSFLVKLLTARSALAGIQTILIDPENEYENLMAGLGCPFISLSAETGDRINIFDVDLVDEEGVGLKADLEDAIKAVQAVVFRMIRVYDPEVLTGRVKVAILEKIKELYSLFGITEDPKSVYSETSSDMISVVGVKKRMPQLSDLVELMRKDPELKEASKILATFTQLGGTASSSIFDCQTTVENI